MAWLSICKCDPLATLVRDSFGANILRTPETRIVQSVVLLQQDDQVRYVGRVSGLLDASHGSGREPALEDSVVASLGSTATSATKHTSRIRRSRSVQGSRPSTRSSPW